ncbi:MAG: DUF2510 domain-containing protein, partial [Microcella sp.]|nr:DUF2510 domain-containing protein [Microcella sp.]
MSDQYAPAAGWYDDPERALRLRWWDGIKWTTHTRAKTVVEHHPGTVVAPTDMSTHAALAVPGATVPYGYSAPASWSPSLPSAASPVNTIPSAAEPMEYVPERTTTPAAWALAVTPLVTLAAQSAAVLLSGFEST